MQSLKQRFLISLGSTKQANSYLFIHPSLHPSVRPSISSTLHYKDTCWAWATASPPIWRVRSTAAFSEECQFCQQFCKKLSLLDAIFTLHLNKHLFSTYEVLANVLSTLFTLSHSILLLPLLNIHCYPILWIRRLRPENHPHVHISS